MENFNTVLSFLDFEKSCKKEKRGGIEMYDVKGHYKWMSLTELYEYYFKK